MLQWFSNIPQDMFPLMSDRNLAPHVSGIVIIILPMLVLITLDIPIETNFVNCYLSLGH